MSYIIGIVEDDIDQQQNYADALNRRGFITHCYHNVDSALEGILRQKPDLVLLDVVLGDDQDGGFTVCKELLSADCNLPIIFLSDRSEEIDQVFGLRLGAWDYQTKPISLALLSERIKNLLRIHKARQAEAEDSKQDATSPLKIDHDRSYVSWHGQSVPLTLTEFRLLEAVIEAGAGGINYQELADRTMQRLVTNGTINSHIKNLRKKMNATGFDFDHIRNKPGFGYCWESD